jgi:hypothetical protein
LGSAGNGFASRVGKERDYGRNYARSFFWIAGIFMSNFRGLIQPGLYIVSTIILPYINYVLVPLFNSQTIHIKNLF